MLKICARGGHGSFQRLGSTVGIFLRNTASKHLSAKREGAAESNNGNDRHASTSTAEKPLQKQDDTTPDIGFGSKVNKGKGDATRPLYIPEVESPDPVNLEPPTTCCMSGCPNCVWLEYAEALTKTLCKSDVSKDKIRKELDNIEDQNIKAFIMMELRTRGLL